MYDYTEFNKLVEELENRGHSVVVVPCYDGKQGLVDDNDWDFIIHRGSWGHEDGLLEVYGMGYLEDGDVEGHLTAQDVLDRLDNPKAEWNYT